MASKKTNMFAPFKGNAIISLDGIIRSSQNDKAQDSFYIALTIGGKEIKCCLDDFNGNIAKFLNVRCIINGLAQYSGLSYFPDYINVYTICEVAPKGDWAKWRGAFDFSNNNYLAW